MFFTSPLVGEVAAQQRVRGSQKPWLLTTPQPAALRRSSTSPTRGEVK